MRADERADVEHGSRSGNGARRVVDRTAMSTAMTARRLWRRSGRYRPHTMTGAVVAVTVIVYVAEVLFPGPVVGALAFSPANALVQAGDAFQPWRMLTTMLVHAPISLPYSVLPITHILFNMYALYLFGRPLENLIGGGRFLALYLLSGFGGSLAVVVAALAGVPIGTVVGASGAVFGVLGASAVVQRRLGGDVRYLVVLIAINFALAFVVRGIAWEAHVGGLLVGALTGWLFVQNRGPRRRNRAVVIGVLLGVGLLALTASTSVVVGVLGLH